MLQDAECDSPTGSSDPVPDAVSASEKLSGLLPIQEVLKRKALSVRLVTWNLHGKQPPENMQELFQPGQHDLYVVGTEECERTIGESFIFRSKQKWETRVQEELGRRYKLVKLEALVAIHIMLLARQDLVPFISSIKSARVASGLGNMFGNKGGVAISCRIGMTDFVFVNSHFAAHADSVPARNQDFEKINTEMPLFPPVDTQLIRNSRMSSSVDGDDSGASSSVRRTATEASAAQRQNENVRSVFSVTEHQVSRTASALPTSSSFKALPPPPTSPLSSPTPASALPPTASPPPSDSDSAAAADPAPSPTGSDNRTDAPAETAKAAGASPASRPCILPESPSKPLPPPRSSPGRDVPSNPVPPPKARQASISTPPTAVDPVEDTYCNMHLNPLLKPALPHHLPRVNSTPAPKPLPIVGVPLLTSTPPVDGPAAMLPKGTTTTTTPLAKSPKSPVGSSNESLSPSTSLSGPSSTSTTAGSGGPSGLATVSSAPVTRSDKGKARPEPLSERFDRVFWMGDLNYRIKGANRELVDNLVKNFDTYGREPLISNDELGMEMRAGNVFQGFREGPLKFRPTYKFDDNSDTYDTSAKRRPPAYTDRILYRYRPSPSTNGCGTEPAPIELVDYNSCPNIRTSDHRPLFAVFSVRFDLDDTSPYDSSKVLGSSPVSAGPTSSDAM